MKVCSSLLLPTLLILFHACGEKEKTGASASIQFPADSITTQTPVEVEKLSYQPFYYLIATTGKIKSLKEFRLQAEVNGFIQHCVTVPNRVVPAGSLLVQLDPIHAQNKIDRGEIARYNARKEYESLLLGYENLLRDKTATEAEAIKKKLYISSGLAQAEQDIKEATYELNKTTITAPFKAVLSDIKIQPGQRIAAGQDLCTLYDPFNLLLEVMIMESDIPLLTDQLRAQVAPINSPETAYTAQLMEMNPYVNENGMILVKLKILQPAARLSLFPGMNCTVTIKAPVSHTLAVAKEAIVMHDDKPVVFTMENGKAQWNYVTTGRDNGRQVEIKKGLRQGQQVIVSNNLQLVHDAEVYETTGKPLAGKK